MFANNWYNVVSDVRNDIVFEKRNKSYGAYQLRKEYNKTLAIIVLSMVAASLIALGVKYFIDNYKPSTEEIDAPKIDITQIDLTPPQLDKTEPPPPPPPPPPPMVETIKFIPPVIKEDAVEDEPPPPQEQVSESNVSTVTQEGSDEAIQIPDEQTAPAVIEEKGPEIFTVVQEMPEFPGGPVEMMKYVQKNIVYPPSAREAGISGKCFIKFVVNEDGRISNVEVLKGVPGCPECDKEAIRVIKSMPPWKPGKQNGKDVKVYFNLPINFTIK